MFRSVAEDGGQMPTLSIAGTPFGSTRRRTRSQAALETNERRERLKRTREAMEAMAVVKRGKSSPKKPPTPTRPTHHVALSTPPRAKIVIGASLGENLTVETTPTKREMQSPPHVRRLPIAPPHVAVPTPEKNPSHEETNTGVVVTPMAATTSVLKTRGRLPARGIAQSSSSGPLGSTRKRMISFSPERAERPINEEAARQKLQRNLKASENLQLRLEGISVRMTPEKQASEKKNLVGGTSNQTANSPSIQHQPNANSAQNANSPPTASNSAAAAVAPSPSQQHSDSPSTEPSLTLELDGANSADANSILAPTTTSSCKKELDFTDADAAYNNTMTLSQDTSSQEQGPEHEIEGNDKENQLHATTTIGFDADAFTSTSVIEDVGLFNCESDVEFTGGVYGEGTDGKVSAATVRGQKVALKRAKPHDGFPVEEAKRRSAVELHYLRKVRHHAGFVQCLGLCDGIEHTCIALEVMDCKLSDYLRRYGLTSAASKLTKSSSRHKQPKCYTLPVAATKAMLRQICEPMATLHDLVNVAHGDLACRNILLRLPPKGLETKWEPVVKLSDFGRIKTPASEPPLFDDGFSFFKNCDVGSFAREILYRLLVGEIVPSHCTETRSLHKQLQDVVVDSIPDAAKEKLGPYYRLFMRCAGWGVRPSFREIADHLDDLEYFETADNGYFPLKPVGSASALESASFLSPIMDGSRHKMPSSGSKQPPAATKYDTPTTAAATPRAAPNSNAPGRLLVNKTLSDSAKPKTVNWLKARSVHPGQPVAKLHARPATAATASANAGSLTPLGRPALGKKTPPSAGASRRSLQILNQIQHREQEKKSVK